MVSASLADWGVFPANYFKLKTILATSRWKQLLQVSVALLPFQYWSLEEVASPLFYAAFDNKWLSGWKWKHIKQLGSIVVKFAIDVWPCSQISKCCAIMAYKVFVRKAKGWRPVRKFCGGKYAYAGFGAAVKPAKVTGMLLLSIVRTHLLDGFLLPASISKISAAKRAKCLLIWLLVWPISLCYYRYANKILGKHVLVLFISWRGLSKFYI